MKRIFKYFIPVLALMAFLASCKNTSVSPSSPSWVWVVSTLAGGHPTGSHEDGTGADARFYNPSGVAVDSKSGDIYVADTSNHRIRKITPGRVVSTLAGGGATGAKTEDYYVDATGADARFYYPSGIALGLKNGKTHIYVADRNNHLIREIIASTGKVSTLAGGGATGDGAPGGYKDGTGANARFKMPSGVAVDSKSGNIYVADQDNHRIRMVTPTGEVSTVAGSTRGYADGADARFRHPSDVAVSSKNGHIYIYVTDSQNHRIRKVTASTGEVSTLAGGGATGDGAPGGYKDGTGANARFDEPSGVDVDSSGNIYVADFRNYRIRKITPTGVVSTIAGGGTGEDYDGIGTDAKIHAPRGVAVDSESGDIYVAELSGGEHRIRKIEYRVAP